jgi:hypothetical protein
MLGAAGWIGALFLLGFVAVGLGSLFRDGGTVLFIGACSCGLAFLIFKTAGDSDLASQFALAVSLAGQFMFLYGLNDLLGPRRDSAVFFAAAAGFEALLTALVPNVVHRVLSASASCSALWFAMYRLGLYGVPSSVTAGVVAALWLNEARWSARGQLWRPIAYGLTFALLLPSPNLTAFAGSSFPAPLFGDSAVPWIRSLLLGGVMMYVVHHLLMRHGIRPSSTAGIGAFFVAAAVAAGTFKAGGVAISLVVLVLGFARGHHVLLGLGVAAVLGYLSHFYYALEMTLLAKSGALAGTGLTLVVLWGLMRLVFGPAPAREAANA